MTRDPQYLDPVRREEAATSYVHDAPCPLSGTEHTHSVVRSGSSSRSLRAALQTQTRPEPRSIYYRIGPPINVLDEVRARHHLMPVASPDDQRTDVCATCYIFDEPWPCRVARLIAVVDEQIAADRAVRSMHEIETDGDISHETDPGEIANGPNWIKNPTPEYVLTWLREYWIEGATALEDALYDNGYKAGYRDADEDAQRAPRA